MAIKQRTPFKNFYYNKLKPQLKLALDDIRHPGNHPKTTAFSMALGMFIGVFIPMGLQVWTLAGLLLLIRFNIFMATLVTLISNPFTILPIYYSGIIIGEAITRQTFPWSYFDMFIEEPNLDYILSFGAEGALIFFCGLFVLGLLVAGITYISGYRLAVFLQKKDKTVLQER